MQFTELHLSNPLQKAVKAMGFEETTPIQTQAIPPGLQGNDIIGCAQTGTGKTAAFLLPALEHLLKDQPKRQENGNPKKRNPRLVILAPTRELTLQVADQARQLAARTRLRTVAVYGGAKIRRQTEKLRRGVDIVIATPGRLMDHMRRKNISFKDLQVLVLDEADRMLDMGFMPDVEEIISRMPSRRQTMLFSATMPPPILSLAQRFQRNPVKIEIGHASPPKAINQAIYPVPKHLKTKLLVALLDQMEVHSMLVFTATKQEADVVTRKLGRAGILVACIHGDFKQRERLAALDGFRQGKHQVLVATNIAARGLDIEGISHVINYDVPDYPEDYVHRIGRTARAKAVGEAITLVTLDDEVMIYRIEHLLGYKIERRTLPGFDYDIPTPSWARPSPEALLRRANNSQTLADKWRSMSRGRGRRRR